MGFWWEKNERIAELRDSKAIAIQSGTNATHPKGHTFIGAGVNPITTPPAKVNPKRVIVVNFISNSCDLKQ